jgi:type II secretory pathway pseudopilin PulG
MPAQRGFTYVLVMLAMLLLSLATQTVMTYVAHQAQREREDDLLRIGRAYAQAIGAYYEATPGSMKRWPRDLSDLIEDRRMVNTRRYLRELYPDPVTRLTNWVLVKAPDGGIVGVHSRSDAMALRETVAELEGSFLARASRYSDWRFIYRPELVTSPAAGKATPSK